MISIKTPLSNEIVAQLKCGDVVSISGTIYTARDAAHKKIIEDISKGKGVPFPIENSMIYYVGPSPAKPGQVIGSAGPTTSYRMDPYTVQLLDLGLKGMIGKGNRDEYVIDSMKNNNAVYFAAVGGAAALLSSKIKSSHVIAYEELGTEAVRAIEVEGFPVTVVIDSEGNNLYELGKQQYYKK